MDYFEFPVNAALLLLLCGGLFVLGRECKGSRVVGFLASGAMSVIALTLFISCSLAIAFFPKSGITLSAPFIFSVILLLSNLLLAIYRYNGRWKIRFYLNHIGIFMVVAGLAAGYPDMLETRVKIAVGESADMAYDSKGQPHPIGYTVTLDYFDIKDSEYVAGVTVSDSGSGKSTDKSTDKSRSGISGRAGAGSGSWTLRVNHPLRISWKEDMYLSAFDTAAGAGSQYCILEFVIQPWKYFILTGFALFALGAVLLLWRGRGSGNPGNLRTGTDDL